MTAKRLITFCALAALALCLPRAAKAEFDITYKGSVTANAGSGDLAPYYIASNRGGTVTQQYSTLLSAAARHDMDTTVRFSYGFGAEVWAGWASNATYDRYNASVAEWNANKQHPARIWLQQLYGEVKFRGVFAELGQKTLESPWLDTSLSSGDLIMSGNARPPIGARGGFVNFQNIPFTKGWVQITGELGWYRLKDDKWLENHYNYYNHFVTTDYWFHYKNIYFRTKPTKPFVFTFGAQASCQFGGTANYYQNGVLTQTVKMDANLRTFCRTLIAGNSGSSVGDKGYVEGNHVGSWDVILQYTFKGGHRLRGYYQSIWEDGSSIGKMNGFDGLWGLEYRHPNRWWINGAVIEYIDLTNQSGHIHWSPFDHESTPITKKTTGNDDYYNNYIYNGYQNRGMSIGSPFVRSTIYNLDGYMRYRDNLMRGFHIGITGSITPELDYRILGSYRKCWGTPGILRAESVHDTSMLFEATYSPARVKGLAVKAQFAFDRGSLYGDATGGLLSVTYRGNLTLGK